MAAIKRTVKANHTKEGRDKPRKRPARKRFDNARIEGRWEKFAQGLFKGLSQTDAYLAAGYDGGQQNAHRLAKRPQVIRRVAELRAAVLFRCKITVEHLVMDLQDDRALARKLDKPGDAIAATMAIAKLLGFLIDKNELAIIMKPASEPTAIRELTIEEWEEQFKPKALPPPNGHA